MDRNEAGFSEINISKSYQTAKVFLFPVASSRFVERGIMRSYRLLFLSLLIILFVVVFVHLMSGDEERSVAALDTNTFVEDRPGTILYEDWGPYETWTSDKKKGAQNLSAESQFISYDVDMDGADELLFMTVNGTLIVLDVPTGVEILNMTFGRYWVHGSYLAVGNLDNDEYREIVLFNGTALICLDFKDEVILWTSEAHLTSNPYRAQGPITLVDPDGDGIDEILVRTNTNYYRLDNNGDIVHNVSLALWGDSMPGGWSYLGWPTRMIVEDLDGDGDLEVFMSGWGWSVIPEILNQGRQFWIIDLASGDIEFSHQFNDTTFFSDPVLFGHDGEWHIAIGLQDYYGGKELLIIDPAGRSWEMVDVCATSNICTLWITLIPDEDDTILFLSTNQSWTMAWSYGKRRILWMDTRGFGGSRFIESTPVVCDIDNDEEWEVIVPIGPIHVYDAATGEEEFKFDSPPGITIYNDERTGFGDYDGDGYTEICQGVEYYFEELFKIYYIDTDVLDYEIEIRSEVPSMTLYAGIANEVPILIRNMTEERLPSLIELSMSNDPWNTFGEYRLFPGNGSQVTTMDGLINVSTYTIEFADEGTLLNLTVIPDWNFSHEGTNDLSVGFTSLMGMHILRPFENLFAVERDLELTGEIITTHSEEVLQEGDWLLPSEALLMSGPVVVYEGTESLHPPRDAFNLDVFDGSAWANLSFSVGETLKIDLLSPSVDGEFKIVVRVFQVPVRKHGLGRYNLTLHVDGTIPFVVDVFPHNSSWFCEPRIPFAILIDDEGSGVDHLSIEYCMVRDLNTTDRLWQHVTPDETTEVELGLRAQSEYSFSEGSTFILWRFTDHLGNKGSTDHVVNIDLHGIYFHDFSPLDWVRTRGVDVNVSVTDRGGSGVNISTLEYSYSHSDLFSFTEWTSAGVYGDGGDPSIYHKYLGVEGSTNLIRFRGRDNAGNEAISSQIYTVWIDTVYPQVEIVDIEPWLRQDPSLRSVRVNLTDWTSGIGGVVAFLHESEGEGTWNLSVEFVEGTVHWAVYDLSWVNGTLPTLNLEVRVWDNAGNHHGNHYRIVLDRRPSIIEISPLDGSSFENGTVVNFTIELLDPDGDDLSVEWWLGHVLLSNEANFSTSSLPVGAHNISVIVRDRYHEVVGRLGITVTEMQEEPVEPPQEEPPKVTRETDWWSVLWLVALVVVIVIAAALALLLRRNAEDR